MTVDIIDNEYKPAEIPDEDKAPEDAVDPNVQAVLPAEAKIKLVITIGASFWALSKKIETTLAGGKRQAYFLKIYSDDLGERMAIAEYEGTKAVNAILPSNSARPVGQGTFANNPDKHFLVLEFHDVDDILPRPTHVASILAQLHMDSKSPEGKFGFHVNVFGGCQRIDTSWSEKWEPFFTRMFRNALDSEIAIHGQNDELDSLREAMFAKVIPRLLRPMETNGREIRPCLLHGDLWHGNVGIDVGSDEVFLFDFASLYGHHEYDMAPWRADRYRTNKTYQAAYKDVNSPSTPKKDADDRNALYAILNDILVSSNWPQTKKTRLLAMDGMRRLIEKFPDGYEGYVEEPELGDEEELKDDESIDIQLEVKNFEETNGRASPTVPKPNDSKPADTSNEVNGKASEHARSEGDLDKVGEKGDQPQSDKLQHEETDRNKTKDTDNHVPTGEEDVQRQPETSGLVHRDKTDQKVSPSEDIDNPNEDTPKRKDSIFARLRAKLRWKFWESSRKASS